MKRKIVLVTDSFNSGGAQKQIVMLANGIAENDMFEVSTIQYYDYNFFEKQLSSKVVKYKLLEKYKLKEHLDC